MEACASAHYWACRRPALGWKETVGVRESPGSNQYSSNPNRRSSISKSDAESLTGISQQQVLKWNQRLQKPEKYRAHLMGVAYKAAMMAATEAVALARLDSTAALSGKSAVIDSKFSIIREGSSTHDTGSKGAPADRPKTRTSRLGRPGYETAQPLGGAGGGGARVSHGYWPGAQLLERILTERRARWEAKQLAKFKEQGKTPPQDWQKKYPEPIQPDTTELPKLPEGWVWASLS